MSDAIITAVNQSSILCKTVIKLNEYITFTPKQIENLLKVQFINMKPQESVTLVSSKLKLGNIEENCTHFWLADMLSSVIRSIQLSRFSVQQGYVIVRWIVHYVSLVIAEKLSKVMLFEKLRTSIIVALENADDYMIPLPNSTECSMSHVSTTKNDKMKYTLDVASDSNKPMTALQIATFIANRLHEIFWDDFKFTVIQMAFDADPIQKINILNTIKDFDPLHQRNDSDDLPNEDTADKDEECFAIMDRYFLRAPNNPSSNYDRLINSLKQSMCRRRRLYVLDDQDKNDENVLSANKYIENICSNVE